MTSVENSVLILLAAGRSRRFGDVGSKLTQPFLGRELGLHVAVALRDMPFRDRLAVVDGDRIDYRPFGFTPLHNDDPAAGMATSVRIGVRRAQELGADTVVIVLADMPRVTATHVYRLFDAADDPAAVVASSDGRRPKPPALFGRERFGDLLDLTGDRGAAEMIKAGRHVVTSPAELIDVDTPAELEQLRETITRGGARRSD